VTPLITTFKNKVWNSCIVKPKLLIRKKHKVLVDGVERTISKQMQYLVQDITKPFNTKFGRIPPKELKKKAGSAAKTEQGKDFTIIEADFLDQFKRLKKFAQTVTLKDIAHIVTETGINKDSVVVDAGAGSGALACYLGHISKQVYTYEIRKESIDMSNHNISALGLKNVTLREKDVTKGISEKNVDVVTLDLPEPWNAISSAHKALKIGGYIVSYSPTVPQVQKFVDSLGEKFLIIKTIEVIERPWVVEGQRVRPSNIDIGHTAFLTFARKIK